MSNIPGVPPPPPKKKKKKKEEEEERSIFVILKFANIAYFDFNR